MAAGASSRFLSTKKYSVPKCLLPVCVGTETSNPLSFAIDLAKDICNQPPVVIANEAVAEFIRDSYLKQEVDLVTLKEVLPGAAIHIVRVYYQNRCSRRN